MEHHQSNTSGLRLAELIAALSLATDLGMNNPLEQALCTCIISVRLGEALGLDEEQLREAYYLGLLYFIGCNADTHYLAALVGDELAMRASIATVDYTRPTEMMGGMFRYLRQMQEDHSFFEAAGVFARFLMVGAKVMREGAAGHCEVAQRLAQHLGFGENIQRALGQAYEFWNGRGFPKGLKGEEIALSVRVVGLAQAASIFHRLEGADAAVTMVQARAGGAYDPALAECFCKNASQVLAGLHEEPAWETVLASEPGAPVMLSEARLDTALRAVADFSDLKSPFMLGHSSGVAELAAEAARQCKLPEAEVVTLRRAGWVHDVGRTGVSAGIWNKAEPLSTSEWERVRLHPYYTERVLARPALLAKLGALAASHHERLDGSGYHRKAPAPALSLAARILGAADTYHAMIEPRPYRPAYSAEAAADELRKEVRAGRLDGEAVNAVLAAAGHRVRAARREWPAGLSEREVEVLRLLARGNSMKQIAKTLVLSEKTVEHHIEHIYNKIGVSTRAAATLFAAEHDLVAE